MTGSALTLILFPGHAVRLATAVGLGAFGALAVIRHDWRPLAAATIWMVGFEAAFDVTLAFRSHPQEGMLHLAFWGTILVLVSIWLRRRGVRPHPILLGAAFVFFAAWGLTGFHINPHSGIDFQWGPELLNETAKMLWAAAFLVPLLSDGGSV